MKHFPSLDHLYERLDHVADLPLRGAAQLGAKLALHREAAYLAQALTRIHCQMPLDTTRHDLRRRVPDRAGLAAFFDRQGFGSLLRGQAERLMSAQASS